MTSGTSSLQTYILLVKGNIGPGCLALPFVFSMLGVVYSLPVLFLVGFFCVYNMWLLVECKKFFEVVKTYGELGLAAFGRRGEVTIEVLLSMMQLSICCVYYTFIGDSLSPVLGLSTPVIILLLIPLFLLITSLRHMRSIAPLSLYASIFLFIALFLILYLCVHQLSEEGVAELPKCSSSKLIVFFVSTVYAFEGIGVILPIEAAMDTPQDFGFVLSSAMTTVSIVYVLFAEVVVLAYGYVDDGMNYVADMCGLTNVVAGVTAFLLHQGAISPAVSITISILISLCIYLSYPLQLYPALQVLEIYCGYSHITNTVPPAAIEDSGIELEDAVVNVLNPKILKRLNVVTDSPIYKRNPFEKKSLFRAIRSLRPPSIATGSNHSNTDFTPRSDISDISSHSNKFNNNNRLQHSTSLESIETFTNSPVATTKYTAIPTTDTSNESLSTTSVPSIPQFAIRYFLVISTGLLAVLIPNVGLLVSLAGASSGATLALIIPPLIDLYVNEDIHSMRYSINCISIGLGVIGAIAGTYLSLVDIVTQVFLVSK